MKKEALTEIVKRHGGAFSGCGCCWDDEENHKERSKFIEILWKKINKGK